MVLEQFDTSGLTGYNDADTYLATRYTQGDRDVYCIDLSLDRITSLVREPDPEKPTEANRRIILGHAQSFASYLRERHKGVIPTLLLRAPSGVFKFKVMAEIEGTSWGELSIPKLARNDIAIIDGQHRILGMHLAEQEVARDLADARSKRAQAQADNNSDLYNHWNAMVEKYDRQRRRFGNERVSAQIVVVDSEREYKQIFVDIADNAKGIAQSTRTRMDSTKVVNRSLERIVEHWLLDGRVEKDYDRIRKGAPYLVTLKDLANVARAITVGLGGRVSRRGEEEFREYHIADSVMKYLDALVEGFSDIHQVAAGSLHPADLRQQSLLGSVTMLRVLANVYRQIDDHSKAVEFFNSLESHMQAPVPADSRWLESSAMQEGALGPISAGMGPLSDLSDTVMKWYSEFSMPPGTEAATPEPITLV